MSQVNRIALVISFFALWITMFFSLKYQQVIGFVVIFLFGILHGANDIALYRKIMDQKGTNSFNKIIIYYIGVVFLGVLLFYSFPFIALLFFIVFSGFHFGEQHWSKIVDRNNFKLIIVFQTIYGLFILFLLFLFHEFEVKKIVYQITNVPILQLDFKMITAFLGIALVISGFVITKKVITMKSEILINIFYLLIFAIIFYSAELIWSFAIYFVIWHSFPSIKEQIQFLYGNFSINNFKSYIKSAFIYWIISLLGIAMLYFIFRDKELFNALFFSFLAAITFPHTIVIIKMKK